MKKSNNKKQPGPNDWLIPFMRLRDRLRSYVDAGLRLHHCIYLYDLPGCAEEFLPSAIKQAILPGEFQQKLVKVIEYPARQDLWVSHCFFSEDSRAYDALERVLNDEEAPNVLATFQSAPKGLPSIRNSRVKSLPDRKVTMWMCLLYHFASTSMEGSFRTKAYHIYGEPPQPASFEKWDSSPGFDHGNPIPLVTKEKTRGKASSTVHLGLVDGIQYPDEVIVALESEVLGASLYAVPLLKYFGTEPYPAIVDQPASVEGRPVTVVRNPADELDRRDVRSRLAVLEVLLRHHGCGSGQINRTPLTQEEIKEKTKDNEKIRVSVSQPTVGRMMKMIMFGTKEGRGAMKKYARLCEEGTICDHLTHLRQLFDPAINVGKKQRSVESEEGEDGHGRTPPIESGKKLRGEMPKGPEEDLMEQESAALRPSVINGIMNHFVSQCEESGVEATPNMLRKALEHAKSRVDSCIKEELDKRHVRPRSQDEEDTKEEVLIRLKKHFLPVLGEQVFGAVQDRKRLK